jgi:hypothetical protein
MAGLLRDQNANTHIRVRLHTRTSTSAHIRTREAKKGKSKIGKTISQKSIYSEKGDPPGLCQELARLGAGLPGSFRCLHRYGSPKRRGAGPINKAAPPRSKRERSVQSSWFRHRHLEQPGAVRQPAILRLYEDSPKPPASRCRFLKSEIGKTISQN